MTLGRSDDGVRVWKSATKGPGNEVLVDSDTKTWDLSDPKQRADFNSLKDSLFTEGHGAGFSALCLVFGVVGQDRFVSDAVVYTFIAGDCGDQPKTEDGQRQRVEGAFPALARCEWSVTAPASSVYNCIAWSVGETDVWYSKIRSIPSEGVVGVDEVYGDNDGVFELSDMDAFYLAKRGWSPSASGPADAMAMYYSEYHAAARKGCACGAGRWIMFESKRGGWERIEHVHDQLNGGSYGTPIRFYK